MKKKKSGIRIKKPNQCEFFPYPDPGSFYSVLFRSVPTKTRKRENEKSRLEEFKGEWGIRIPREGNKNGKEGREGGRENDCVGDCIGVECVCAG